MVRPSVVHDNFVSGGDEDGCLCEQLSLFLALLLLVGLLNVMRGQCVERLHSVIFRPEMDTKVITTICTASKLDHELCKVANLREDTRPSLGREGVQNWKSGVYCEP